MSFQVVINLQIGGWLKGREAEGSQFSKTGVRDRTINKAHIYYQPCQDTFIWSLKPSLTVESSAYAKTSNSHMQNANAGTCSSQLTFPGLSFTRSSANLHPGQTGCLIPGARLIFLLLRPFLGLPSPLVCNLRSPGPSEHHS